jgi:hypothetical protein
VHRDGNGNVKQSIDTASGPDGVAAIITTHFNVLTGALIAATMLFGSLAEARIGETLASAHSYAQINSNFPNKMSSATVRAIALPPQASYAAVRVYAT